ncbi:LAFA_0E04456g1_1 [Lachancea sp. 'fantastica']|nr:LAFA_0E04456g1_1 [Lachancea sp. 'fantastica']
MERPDLPPKGAPKSASSTSRDDCELPENINLLPAKVIAQLASEDREHLKDYVMRFEDCKDVENGSSELVKRLKLLMKGFRSTEERRERLKQSLSETKELEKDYETNWTKLNNLMATTYSDEALGLKMKKELEDLDHRAAALESNRGLDIDDFIAQYLEIRQQHHAKREMLCSWQKSR